MFVVRHNCDGIDRFYEAESVEYFGPHAAIGPHGLHLKKDVEPPRDGTIAVLLGGTAYVMNEQGATVAKYALPDAPRVAHDTQEAA